MNNSRRKRIAAAFDQISKAKDLLSEVASEELDSLDSLPENLKNGQKGETMEANVDTLDEATNLLEEVQEIIEELI